MARNTTKWLSVCLGSLLSFSAIAHAQDAKSLLDLLVKKGIVTDQEAADITADLKKTSAKNNTVTVAATDSEFRIFGDLRIRYETRSGENGSSGDHQERDRFRYRLRLGFTGKVGDDFFYGFRLEPSTNGRSANITMADDAGSWGKTSDTVNIGQVYIGWKPTSEWTFEIGRMPNPLVTTSMVWDADINPEGVAEQFKTKVDNVEWFANLGQFLYGTAGSQNVFGSTPTNKDVYLFAWQGGAKIDLGNGLTLQAAPTIYNYVNTSQTQNPSPFKGAFSAANMTAVNNLFVLDLPIELGFKLDKTPARVFADVAYNTDGKDRARKWGRPDLDDENKAYQIGFQYGKAAKKGEWDAKIFWQSVDAFALDTNLVDSDLFDSRTNMKGWVVSGDYAVGNATQVALTIANGRRRDGSIVAPGSGDIGTGNLDHYWLGQLDLNIKF